MSSSEAAMASQSVPRSAQAAKSTVQTLVYDELRRSVMQGVFAPGHRLSLRRLAEFLGTSIMPVRGAVTRLIAEQAFEGRPNRMVVVPEMSRDKLLEITYWRVQLESHAARLASQHIESKTIRQLKKLNDDMSKHFDAGQWDQVLTKNYEFHFSIYRAAKSTILVPMIENLWLQVGPFTYFALPSPKFVWNGAHHAKLLAALASRDGKAASIAMRADIEASADFLVKNSFDHKPTLRSVRRERTIGATRV
jgi:DNA-binding GntR family transcriptional regulator